MEITTSILMDSYDLNRHTMAGLMVYEWLKNGESVMDGWRIYGFLMNVESIIALYSVLN
jgi:hypothetical protein